MTYVILIALWVLVGLLWGNTKFLSDRTDVLEKSLGGLSLQSVYKIQRQTDDEIEDRISCLHGQLRQLRCEATGREHGGKGSLQERIDFLEKILAEPSGSLDLPATTQENRHG